MVVAARAGAVEAATTVTVATAVTTTVAAAASTRLRVAPGTVRTRRDLLTRMAVPVVVVPIGCQRSSWRR
ncbi:hypothetical protein GCM10012279_52810 [Micromonospora yangpuensis]|nr:hypothetical protein GCM10012279_52810 [Micromonospora yangpuensis]